MYEKRESNYFFTGFALSFFAYIFLRAVLDYSYVVFVADVFSYQGYQASELGLNYIYSWLGYIFVVVFVPVKLRKPSDFFCSLFVASYLAPLSSLYGISGWSATPFVISCASFFFIFFVSGSRVIKSVRFPLVREGEKVGLYVSLFFVAVLLVWFVISGAIFNINFNLSTVYDYREVNSGMIDVGFFSYLNNWVYKIFSIYLIFWAAKNKKNKMLFVFIFFQVVMFGVSTHKSVLFYPLVVLFVYYYFSRYSGLFIYPFMLGVVVSLSLACYIFWADILIPSMFIRRVFYVPAFLTYQYWDFFEFNSFVYWSNSFLSSFIDYPYHDRITKMIGFYMDSLASVNNGFVSSGYSHAGYWGVFIYSFLISLVLVFVNSLVRRMEDLWISVAILAVPLRELILSSDLPTTLLTHGLLVALLMIFLVRGEDVRS